MSKFKAPSNVKQIGNPDAKIKIYIEDYAYTYIQQYSSAGDFNERLAFLIGKNINDGDKNIILINGAICAKHIQHDDGILNITKETWNNLYEQIDRYFNGYDVVGLMQSQPGYGSYLNEKYVAQFRNNFNKLYQTFLLCDPMENLNVFHIFDSQREKLNPLPGYFIYYQKNEPMNEYMIANKEIKKEINTEKQEPTEIALRKRQFDRIKKSNNDQRKIVNMLASLSAVLFLICFIMGTGLVQNEERITKLESKLQTLDKNTKTVFSNLDNATEKSLPLPSPSPLQDLQMEQITDDPQPIQTPLTTQTIVPTQTPVPTTNNEIPKTYTVKSGDSLSGISRRIFGSTSMMNKIMELNKLDDPDKIYIGMVLKLPREF